MHPLQAVRKIRIIFLSNIYRQELTIWVYNAKLQAIYFGIKVAPSIYKFSTQNIVLLIAW